MAESKVYNEDCMIGMSRYPDKHFDLAIVDPPYGINAERGTNRASRKMFKSKEYGWDKEIPSQEYFNELLRVSKDQIIWGGNYFLDILGNTRGYLIWDKLNPDRNFADCEFAWSSIDQVARILKLKRVQELNVEDGGKIHPTQKPVALYKYIMKKWGGVDFRILDTHLGSGSSRIAADELGFDFTGFELDKEYYEAQELRFKNYKSQLKLL
jgi:site-specific DNA-methyltransferase (adenine-specific)